MARRASSADGGVSLFPFMSILACLIGILTLMISVTIALKSLETSGRGKEELERARKHQSLLAQQQRIRKETEALKATLRTQNSTALELSELDLRRIVLRRQLDEKTSLLKKPDQTDKALQKLIETMLANIEALRKERPALEKKLADLKAELARRKIKPDNKPVPILIQPGGTGTAHVNRVTFVECDSSGIILHRRGQPSASVSLAAIGSDQNYNRLLEEAKGKAGSMILFLLRDTGHHSYLRAAGWAESQYQLRTGKLPLPGKGELDLSLFYQP
jgi:hypothetical protein